MQLSSAGPWKESIPSYSALAGGPSGLATDCPLPVSTWHAGIIDKTVRQIFKRRIFMSRLGTPVPRCLRIVNPLDLQYAGTAASIHGQVMSRSRSLVVPIRQWTARSGLGACAPDCAPDAFAPAYVSSCGMAIL